MPTSSLREKVAEICGWVETWNCSERCPQKPMDSAGHISACWRNEPPPYDTSTDAALEAWAVIAARGWHIMLFDVRGGWAANFWRPSQMELMTPVCPTLAQAICEAICKASEREKA